eukprot:904959-Rhodomonas_salina.3
MAGLAWQLSFLASFHRVRHCNEVISRRLKPKRNSVSHVVLHSPGPCRECCEDARVSWEVTKAEDHAIRRRPVSIDGHEKLLPSEIARQADHIPDLPCRRVVA